MTGLPTSLEDAIAQAKAATRIAFQDGVPRLLVELVYPELKAMPVAEAYIPVLQELGLAFKVYFPDAGAAALARRDWDNPEFSVRAIGELKGQIEPEDEAFLFVDPSAVEVNAVEEMCTQAGGRPVIMLNPRLEDVAIIGIGYAGRQLRERFLSTLEQVYYLRPLEGAVLLRSYPGPWQVWRETAEGHELVAEMPQKPSGEDLDRILFGEVAPTEDEAAPVKRRKGGFLAELQSFLRALSQ
ncbi:DUF1995 family protein [Pseudanabaena sp. FACHB-2040]|uniref:DUF1995 family protein n=1 Tax=Pseudanabaena sp. FACHB-2040 TaxID=2692859 RepID=UPI00168451E5|nr:DUF1995 family protein [Pseudanabaena sp. FACHB-2040]MBD2259204.1 DUF1995 family protein [Pseudanabaena sp. FACHB-2040]